MKLSYEQLRHLASLGDPSGQLTVKNRKGQVIRPSLKQWGPKTPKGNVAQNAIHIYDGAAETVPCPYGQPFPDLPTTFLLAAPTASGKP